MSELIDAVYDNDIDLVEQLLNNNVDIELQDQAYGDTALIAAVNQAPPQPGYGRADIEVSIQIIRLLLENGALPNIQNDEGRTALMKASQEIERIGIVRLLLERGANPNIPDNDGDTALIWASCYTSGRMVDLLLNNGADPNIQNNDGQTALIGASEYGHTDIVRLLLDSGVDIDIDIQNGDGDTALNLAIKGRGRWVRPEAGDQGRRTEIVRLLLDRGANPNIPDNDGHIALTIAERGRRRTEIVRLLRRYMGLQKAKQRLALSQLLGLTKDYDTFIKASESLEEEPYDPRVTRRMIVEEENEIMDLQKAKQRLALSQLLGLTKDYDTFIKASESLEEEPYDPEVDERMREEEEKERIREEEENKRMPYDPEVDDRIREEEEKERIKEEEENEMMDHLDWLKSFSRFSHYGGKKQIGGVDEFIFLRSIIDNNIDEVRQLLDSGADPNVQANNGDTALIWASYMGRRTEIVQLLLDRGADIDFKGEHGFTALIMASSEGNTETVRLLLEIERGADPNIQNNHGDTALIWASSEGHTEIVELLLERGADPNIPDNDGWTPSSLASRKGNIEIVRLIERHMDQDVFDSPSPPNMELLRDEAAREIQRIRNEAARNIQRRIKGRQTRRKLTKSKRRPRYGKREPPTTDEESMRQWIESNDYLKNMDQEDPAIAYTKILFPEINERIAEYLRTLNLDQYGGRRRRRRKKTMRKRNKYEFY